MKKLSHPVYAILLPLYLLHPLMAHGQGAGQSTTAASEATTQAQSDQEGFIKNLLSKGVKTLNDAALPIQEKEKNFIALFRENFYLKSIAGSTLRPGEARAAAEKLPRFQQLFEAMVFRVYMKQIEQLSLNGFKVTSHTTQPDGAIIVKTLIERKDNSEPFKVDWVLYNQEGRLWVFDVVVDGVSLGQVQRQKIQDIRQGGDLQALMDAMEKEYAQNVMP